MVSISHSPTPSKWLLTGPLVRGALLLGTLLVATLLTTTNTALHHFYSELLLLDLTAKPQSTTPSITRSTTRSSNDQNRIRKFQNRNLKEQEQLSPSSIPQQRLPRDALQSAGCTSTIAYAISLVKCGDHQSTSAGLVDAALVLRHSIHLTSSRVGKSRYDYHMVAIVHRDAVKCSKPLQQAGFTVVVVDPPVQPKDIVGSPYLAKYIRKEWCCGHDEFIKLFAYQLPVNPYTGVVDPIVVHVDIDFAMYQPMDHLFDAMLFDKNSNEGKAAHAKLQLERPDDVLPDRIDAYITRDYPQLLPSRIPGYQAGFLVARHDPTVLPEVVNVIQYSNYTEGFARDNGWGGKGYGGYVGAMAMQGVMAYYYDQIRPHSVVELNSCRYNHMGMDNLYRNYPAFNPRGGYTKWIGKCRSQRDDCEDCTRTNVTNIYNVHYTMCRKPWNCVGQGVPGGTLPGTGTNKGNAIDTNTGSYEHCVPLVRAWHQLRVDLETSLYGITHDELLKKGTKGQYKPDMFLGHCNGEGGNEYLQIQAKPSSVAQLATLYKDPVPVVVANGDALTTA